MLSDIGANVIRIERQNNALDAAGAAPRITGRGTRSVVLDLQTTEGVRVALNIIATADALLEGFRPGVMERLGLDPTTCLSRNPNLVYARMTGWGQNGPLAQSAGHDLNYIALSGALSCMGKPDEPPFPPLNLVGDYGAGATMLALSVVSALLSIKNGKSSGQTIDLAMSDGAAMLMLPIYGMLANGRWNEERGTNTLDGSAPYYRCYRCADNRWVSIACIEPKFHATLLQLLGISQEQYGSQSDRTLWTQQASLLERIFLTRSRDQWCTLLEGTDACFAPVLTMTEAPLHPHNLARQSFIKPDGITQPAPPIRFGQTRCTIRGNAPATGADTVHILKQLG